MLTVFRISNGWLLRPSLAAVLVFQLAQPALSHMEGMPSIPTAVPCEGRQGLAANWHYEGVAVFWALRTIEGAKSVRSRTLDLQPEGATDGPQRARVQVRFRLGVEIKSLRRILTIDTCGNLLKTEAPD
jgi:hypothetical protein